MRRKETLVYGVLLSLTLGLAWSIHHAEEPEEEAGSVVFDPGAGVTSMSFENETSVATIEVEGSGDDLETWITAGKKEKIETEVEITDAPADDDDSAEPPSDDDDSAKESPPKAPEAESTQPTTKTEITYGDPILRQFPGNASATKLVESFSPLKALRQFEGLDEDALSQMGLDAPKGSLTIESAAGSVTFEIGEKSYGSSDTYVRVAGNNTVFLVSSKDLSPLRGAENRLVDRILLDAESAEIAHATVTIGGVQTGAKRLHQGRHDKKNSFWVPEDNPDDKDTVFGGFVEKVLQLRASSFPTDVDAPAEQSVSGVFAMVFGGESSPLGTIELGRTVDDDKSSEDELVYKYFARSNRTRNRWAQVSKANAGDLEDQLSQIIE